MINMALAKDSIKAGGPGIAIGRNVFQAEDPRARVCEPAKIVHEGYSAGRSVKGIRLTLKYPKSLYSPIQHYITAY